MSFSKEIRRMITSRAFVLTVASIFILLFIIANVGLGSYQNKGYLGISTFGESSMIEKYFPNNDRTLNVGETVSWHVNVYNQMNDLEYLSVRMKLINSTHGAPDDILHIPSSGAQIFEARQVVLSNSTVILPINWTLTSFEKSGDDVVIKGLNVNGVDIHDLDVQSKYGKDYRMIIELWLYDNNAEDFTFAWSTQRDISSAWNQIWFNVDSI